MPHALELEYQNMQSQSRTPLWEYIGIVIIGLFISWLANEMRIDDYNEQEYLTNPRIGDVYEYEIEIGEYSAFKVIRVHGDSLFVANNRLSREKKNKVSKIDKAENYLSSSYGIARAEVKDMHEKNIVYNIERGN